MEPPLVSTAVIVVPGWIRVPKTVSPMASLLVSRLGSDQEITLLDWFEDAAEGDEVVGSLSRGGCRCP